MRQALSGGSSSQQRILDAATAAFSERGYHGTTTRDIAERAGMSPAALYLHHSSKEELLFAISGAGNEYILDLVRAAAADAITPTQRLHAVVHAFVLWHAKWHTRGRIVNYELASLSDEHRALVDEQRRAIKRVFRTIVEAGLTTGEFDVADASITTMAIISLGIDVARWYSDEKAWSPEYVATHVADMALRLVNAGGADVRGG
jgi:AcrR family transcriptional regulator